MSFSTSFISEQKYARNQTWWCAGQEQCRQQWLTSFIIPRFYIEDNVRFGDQGWLCKCVYKCIYIVHDMTHKVQALYVSLHPLIKVMYTHNHGISTYFSSFGHFLLLSFVSILHVLRPNKKTTISWKVLQRNLTISRLKYVFRLHASFSLICIFDPTSRNRRKADSTPEPWHDCQGSH